MRTAYAVILCAVLLLVSAWFTSVYFLDGAVRMPPNEAMLTGKEAIGKQTEMDHDKNTPVSEVSTVDEALSSGDLAIARGKYTSTWTPKASGLGIISEQDKWVATYQRQSDGKRKSVHEIENSDQPAPGSTASGEDEQALYQIERDMAEALVKKDAAAWEKMLANEFQANYASVVGNKKQLLAAIKSNTTKFESMTNSEMKAIVFGDTAIVHGLSTAKGSMGGKDTSGLERYTDVFVKRDGRWQCVTGYSTKVQ